jgi:hypothetical protein
MKKRKRGKKFNQAFDDGVFFVYEGVEYYISYDEIINRPNEEGTAALRLGLWSSSK